MVIKYGITLFQFFLPPSDFLLWYFPWSQKNDIWRRPLSDPCGRVETLWQGVNLEVYSWYLNWRMEPTFLVVRHHRYQTKRYMNSNFVNPLQSLALFIRRWGSKLTVKPGGRWSLDFVPQTLSRYFKTYIASSGSAIPLPSITPAPNPSLGHLRLAP